MDHDHYCIIIISILKQFAHKDNKVDRKRVEKALEAARQPSGKVMKFQMSRQFDYCDANLKQKAMHNRCEQRALYSKKHGKTMQKVRMIFFCMATE